jgi:transposase
MRDQHAAVQALAAGGLGLRAIARELGVDRKTARRFAHAVTSDEAVARAVSRPTVLDRYQPYLHRRWNQGCHDVALLHAEITALGYRGSLRTVYRYLQPLRTGTDPAALTPSALKIGEVTSWLLRRTEDLNPCQQQLLADLRGHCAQLDRLAGHVTSFAKMMTRRTGQQDLAGWLERVEADDQPELHTFAAGIRHDLAAVTAGLTLPYSSGPTEGNVNPDRRQRRGGGDVVIPVGSAGVLVEAVGEGLAGERAEVVVQNGVVLRQGPQHRQVRHRLGVPSGSRLV